jgi:DNA repair exonuclease SbcCD ATPase subunit
MRKLLFCFFVLVLPTAQLKAQTKALSDSLADIYKRYNQLTEALENTKKSAETNVSNLQQKYQSLENQSQANSQVINELGKRVKEFDENDVVNATTLFNKSKMSFINTATFMEKVDGALRDLNSAIANFSYATTISKLNNPTNNELGFSLDKAVIDILEQKILSQIKPKKGFADRFKSIVQGIIQNPLVTPFAGIAKGVVGALTATVPAVSSITSVFNTVQSYAINEPNVSAEALAGFTKELQKFVQHYESLAKASQELENSLSQLRLKMETVRKVAENFTQKSIADVYTNDGLPDLSKMELEEMVKKYFTYRIINDYVGNLERNATGANKYNYLSKRLVYPSISRTQASFIMSELEKLHNEYLAGLGNYQKNVLAVLENAKKTGITPDPNAISNKINELDGQYQQVLKAYLKDIEIEEVKAAEANIPRH